MIEAFLMIAAGFGFLYWAFRVSHQRSGAVRDSASHKRT